MVAIKHSKTLRALVTIALAASGAIITAETAFAASLRVQMACASDYWAHCSAHSPDSPGVRSCMRAAGASLSKRCVNALVAEGEVSAAEVAHRRAAVARTAAK